MSNLGSLNNTESQSRLGEAQLRVVVVDKRTRTIASATQPVGFVEKYPNGERCGPARVVDIASVVVRDSKRAPTVPTS